MAPDQNKLTFPACICVARHGETAWNLTGVLQGWLDVPLNDTGRKQAREMTAIFAKQSFTAIWSSPLVRARESAEIIADILKLPAPICHEGLKERNFGNVQGIPKSELAELNPVLLQQIASRNPAATFEGGESMDEFADRVLAAIKEIAGRHSGETVLVITHGWVIDVITRHVSNLPRQAILGHKRKNFESLWLNG